MSKIANSIAGYMDRSISGQVRKEKYLQTCDKQLKMRAIVKMV